MVSFELKMEQENYAIYQYWTENNEKNDPDNYGIFAFDKDKMTYIIVELAPSDCQHVVSIEEQLEMRESINRAKKEAGFQNLTEEEYPSPKSELIFTFYADHAYNKIKKHFVKGELLKHGKSYWY